MLGGFDPRSEKLFFQRRRGGELLLTLLLYAGTIAWFIARSPVEQTVEVELEPDLQDFAVEEEKEPEVEEEPPPPPPPNAKIDVTKKPQKKKKIEPPKAKPIEAAPETSQAKTYAPGAGQSDGTPSGTGKEPRKAPPKQETPKPKVEPPKPKVKPAAEPIDPTKPIDRPEKATMPKADSGNKAPDYPEALRDAGITGHVKLKIHIHRDGTVRGAKVLAKRSSATTDEEKADAEKKFLAAAIAAVKSWKYEPAKLEGEPISIWFPVDFPFSLTGG
jgi:protein TonB